MRPVTKSLPSSIHYLMQNIDSLLLKAHQQDQYNSSPEFKHAKERLQLDDYEKILNFIKCQRQLLNKMLPNEVFYFARDLYGHDLLPRSLAIVYDEYGILNALVLPRSKQRAGTKYDISTLEEPLPNPINLDQGSPLRARKIAALRVLGLFFEGAMKEGKLCFSLANSLDNPQFYLYRAKWPALRGKKCLYNEDPSLREAELVRKLTTPYVHRCFSVAHIPKSVTDNVRHSGAEHLDAAFKNFLSFSPMAICSLQDTIRKPEYAPIRQYLVTNFNVIAAQLLSALDEIHSTGHVHGDIKLDNMFADVAPGSHYPVRDYIGKFADFEFNAPIGSECVAGTPRCMAPEVLAGEGIAFWFRVDVYKDIAQVLRGEYVYDVSRSAPYITPTKTLTTKQDIWSLGYAFAVLLLGRAPNFRTDQNWIMAHPLLGRMLHSDPEHRASAAEALLIAESFIPHMKAPMSPMSPSTPNTIGPTFTAAVTAAPTPAVLQPVLQPMSPALVLDHVHAAQWPNYNTEPESISLPECAPLDEIVYRPPTPPIPNPKTKPPLAPVARARSGSPAVVVRSSSPAVRLRDIRSTQTHLPTASPAPAKAPTRAASPAARYVYEAAAASPVPDAPARRPSLQTNLYGHRPPTPSPKVSRIVERGGGGVAGRRISYPTPAAKRSPGNRP